MEEAPQGILELPRRQYSTTYKFPKSARKQCVTNHYFIQLGPKHPIFQMVFDTEPAIPNDSRDLLFECIRCIKKQIKENVDLIAISGKMLWGLKQLKCPLSLVSQFLFQSKNYKFQVIIKTVKILDPQELMSTPEGQVIIFQIYNNQIKQILRQRQIQELQRGKYFDKKEAIIKETGLNILRGFKFTLCNLKSGLHLQVDVCSRIYRAANLLEELSKSRSQRFAKELVGSTVLTNYGKRRTYKICKIHYDMNPYSKFWHDKKVGQISYAQYYQENYGIKVSVKNQPLVQVVLRTEKTFDKKTNSIISNDIIGYLIPEFISLSGISEEQRSNFTIMKEVASFTQLKPHERITQISKLVQVLNKNGRLKIGEPRRITAYQLVQPDVKLFGNIVMKNHGDGNMNIRDKLRHTVNFKDYIIVYSQGNNSQQDDIEANELWRNLEKASKNYGINFKEPGFIVCQSNLQSWKNSIKEDIVENGKPQIVILYLNPQEQKFYGQLKRFLTCQLKVPCQAIRRKSIVKAKNAFFVASKIILQMNQKVGGTAWEVIQQQNAYTSKKKTMYGSFAISKGKSGFTLSFVGTLDSKFTKVFCYSKTGYKSKEGIPEADFQVMLKNWAKNYVAFNQVGPQLIIVYREGLSEHQIKKQVKVEVDALKRVINLIRIKTKQENYNAQVIYTSVTTNINSRFFELLNQNNTTNTSKFAPSMDNPSSGTVVMDELTINNKLDFFLASQKVTEGTCTPTHYQITYNTSKISIEQFSQFTYEQCFNYYNWTAAVKVPATMQYANKLAKLVGESIQLDIDKGELQTSYFFL